MNPDNIPPWGARTVAWFQLIKEVGQSKGEPFRAAWAIVFKLTDRNPDDENSGFDIPEEVFETVERIYKADIDIDYFFSRDGDEMFILLAATETVLKHEATHHMGELPIKMKIYSDKLTVSDAEGLVQPAVMDGCLPFHAGLIDNYVRARTGVLFHSGARQRIVLHRIERITAMTFELKRDGLTRQDLLKKAKKKQKSGHLMQSYHLKALLESYGCTTLSSNQQTVTRRLPLSMQLYAEVLSLCEGARVAPAKMDAAVKEMCDFDSCQVTDKVVTSGSFSDYFPCHDRDELEYLIQNWADHRIICLKNGFFIKDTTALSTRKVQQKYMAWWYQPIDEVRDYFGDHVGLYFAWVGLYTKWLQWPALLGIFVMCVQVMDMRNEAGDETITINGIIIMAYSIYLALWSTLFIEYWNRLECELKFQWGSEGFEGTELPRSKFKGKIELVELTGTSKLVHDSACKRNVKLWISWMFGTGIILLVVFLAFFAYIFRNLYNPPEPDTDGSGSSFGVSCDHCAQYQNAAGEFLLEGCDSCKESWFDRNKFKYGSSLLSLVWIQTATQVYKQVARRLTKWENHRTNTEDEDSLIIKNFMFEFINNYFTLFYIAFLIQIKVPGFRQNGCEGSSCMAVLQKQLMVVFTVKQLVSQIKQIVKPKLKRCMRVRKENKSIKKENKKAMMESVDAASAKVISTEFENPLEEEYMYEPYTSTFEDFKEMSIQFGYVTLFAACYPLAGLLAWLNNVTELRLDSYQVCKMHRRSMWRVQEDIGSWGGVFNVLSIICVITNACLVGFVGSQLAPGTASFGERVRRADLWVVVIMIEHSVFTVRFALSFVVPSIPEWIEDAKEALSNRRTSDMRPPELSSVLAKADATVGELPPERVKKKALKLSGAETGFMPARVHDSEATVQNPLAAEAPMEAPPVPERVMLLSTADDPDDNQAPADTPPAVELPPAAALPLPPQPAVAEEDPAKAKLLAVWARMDLDGSGTLDWGEVQQVMVAMGQDVDEIDMDAAMAEMDGDMSGEVSLDEFETWWDKQDPEAQEQLLLLQEISFD